MRESVYTLLHDFHGPDPLKRLFWSELNYDRANQPLSTRDWSDDERTALTGEPLLLAEHGDFHIIYGQLSGGLLRGSERIIVNKLLPSHPYALFVFSDKSQRHWHFVNVKYDRDISKRRIFRRITVEPGERLRTAAERLSMLDLETVSRDLFGIPPLAIQQRHDQAFDVEAVTREFFRDYDKLFRRAEAHVSPLQGDRRLYTQKLFNRLMFIMFLERKGWLQFNGRTDYLRALWENYQQTKQQYDEESFYWNRLYLLFFSGLNYPYNLRATRQTYLHNRIGSVPYLNGGLFEQDDDDENRTIQIPDAVFEAAINDLFYRYNFTVAEATPLDVEVAVDPEMLGKVFEELVTGRHETGSYYTPKPVVSFMCSEALKGYLQTTLPDERMIDQFVNHYDASGLYNPEAVLQALRRITVCDPACGSGAYLLGMLQELLQLRASLFTARNVDTRSVYDRKLEIIQNNIYGVDIDPFAVNIAHLRLWLSLIVDFQREREDDEPPTLPNLDYKIEVGDSVLGPDPSGAAPRAFDRLLVERYVQAKEEYLTSHGEDKKRLHKEVEQLKSSIRTWTGYGLDGSGFDWVIEFAEVFGKGGFDVVVANPPYVRMELFKDIKPALKKNFVDVHSERADLYIYFYARAVQMLRPGGMLSFISSNKWFRADYGAKLRRFLADQCNVWSITDFGELPVFQTAATFPMIFVARKGTRDRTPTIFTQVKSLGEPYPDVAALIEQTGQTLPVGAINDDNWTLTNASTAGRLRRMEQAGVALSEYVKGQIYYGIKTGFNTAFVINGETREALIAQDPKSAEIIKPFMSGDDVRRWRINYQDEWLLYMYHSIDVTNLDAIVTYMRSYRQRLEQRATRQQWYELQQPSIRYTSTYENPKIVYPEIAT